MKRSAATVLLLLALASAAWTENFRAKIAGRLVLTDEQSKTITLSYIDSAIIALRIDPRFVRGIELELKAPPTFLKQRGALAMALYASLQNLTEQGVVDLSGDRAAFEPLPAKIQSVWQIPLRENHGFTASPYVSLPCGPLSVKTLPLLFRIMPVIKGLSEEIESMAFQLTARAILADEGALRVQVRFPEDLRDRPFTLRLDGDLIEAGRELVLKSGEHHLSLESDDYRNESRQIVVEKGRSTDFLLELQDPTPRIIIEAPENAIVQFDERPIADPRKPFAAEPGEHEIRFLIGDYSVVKMIQLRKGQTYRVSLLIDVIVTENR